ncbi:HEAT repeat domain-containing protein [Novosphingobium sp.]|uniref:HEAT repeat domain-containing protein n=1 Tax=Novosphingobium sp. TaxID=1874826 RepID=UPI0038BCFFB5
MPFTRSDRSNPGSPVQPPAIPATADMLARDIGHETASARRAQMVTALVTIDTPEAAAALADLLAHPDPAVRACGVDGLRRIRPTLARPRLAQLLADASAEIRIRALDAIERLPDAEVESWLIALLGRETESNVCAIVLDLLAEMGTPIALPAIRAARLRFANEPFIAFAADLAISQIAES